MGHGLGQDRLAQVRAVRDGAADGPGHLLLQGLVEGLVAEEGPRAEGQHAGAEAPDELLLRRPVHLDGQHPLVAAGQPGEERFLRQTSSP